MLELRIIAAGTTMPLFDLPAALGRSAAAREIGDTIEGLIAFMDDLGGDPDVEANGDELDGNGSEDDFMQHLWADGLAGCPIADPAEDDDNDHEHDGREPEEDAGDPVLSASPRYGVDQGAGPINHFGAARDHHAAEMGLVRSPTGGWRKPS